MGKKIYLNEAQFQAILKRSIKEDVFYDSGDDEDEEDSENIIEKDGVKVIPDEGGDITEVEWGKFRTILPLLQDSNDDSVQSFSLTRSQIAYALWPDMDKDSARSKLSQKIQGDKPWREKELNKIANIIGL